jgi:hypothetical protein
LSTDDDIKPPILPEINTQEQKQKTGGFRSLFSRKPKPTSENLPAPENIPPEKVPIPQAPIEQNILEKPEEPPIKTVTPHEEVLAQIPTPSTPKIIATENKETQVENDIDDMPLPPEEIQKALALEKPNIDKFQTALKNLKNKTEKEHLINFTIKGGKKVVTLSDLLKTIQQMSAEEYDNHYAENHFATWVRIRIYDNELAAKMLEAKSKEAAISVIDNVLKPKILLNKEATSKPKDEDHIEEHFTKLQEENKKTMEELAKLAKGKETEGTKDFLIKKLVLPDGKTIEKLEDLVIAISLLKEDTYKSLIETRKEDFIMLLKILTEKAAQVASIKPVLLQASIVNVIEEQNKSINTFIIKEKEKLQEEKNALSKKEEELAAKEKERAQTDQDIIKKIELLQEQRKQWEKDVNERETKLDEKEENVDKLITEQEKALQVLKERTEENEKRYNEQEQKLIDKEREKEKKIFEKKEELRKEELRIIDKKEEELRDVNEEKKRQEEKRKELENLERQLKEREAQINADKQAYEGSMKKRETLVQESVDKIIAIDQDITSQKNQIEKLKHEIDTEGFQKYLQRALREINTDHISFKKLPQEEETQKKHTRIYGKIDACNDAIENKDIIRAKILYKELKDIFEKEPLEQAEKDTLYDAIQELYANLHLATLQE